MCRSQADHPEGESAAGKYHKCKRTIQMLSTSCWTIYPYNLCVVEANVAVRPTAMEMKADIVSKLQDTIFD